MKKINSYIYWNMKGITLFILAAIAYWNVQFGARVFFWTFIFEIILRLVRDGHAGVDKK